MFFKKSSKNRYLLTPTSGKTMYTVLVCGSASGLFMSPLVVFKGLHVWVLYGSWHENASECTVYNNSPSGCWMTVDVFKNKFKKHFAIFVSGKNKPVLLLFDGHGSHLTCNTVQSATENSIIISCIPASTRHALQLLDVGLFYPMKVRWRKILLCFYHETWIQAVEKGSLPTILKILRDSKTSSHLINGFKQSGLWPHGRNTVRVEKCVT